MLPVQSSIQSIIKVKLVLEIGDQLRIVIHRILGILFIYNQLEDIS
jgi:hypothetical protein